MDCIQIPALILTSYVTLGQLFNLFILQFSPSALRVIVVPISWAVERIHQAICVEKLQKYLP